MSQELPSFIIQMSGCPGSGKSTLSALLATAIDAVVIDHDLLRSFFLDNELTFDHSGRLAYRLQTTLASAFAKQGRSVIIDSPCNHHDALDPPIMLARELGFEYVYVECRMPVEQLALLDERLRSRQPQRCQRTGVGRPPADSGAETADESAYRELFEKWVNRPCRPEGDVSMIAVDTMGRPEECLQEVLTKIMPQKAP
jgi:predicted kinase